MIVNKNLYCLTNVCQPGRKVIEHAMKERNELVNRCLHVINQGISFLFESMISFKSLLSTDCFCIFLLKHSMVSNVPIVCSIGYILGLWSNV